MTTTERNVSAQAMHDMALCKFNHGRYDCACACSSCRTHRTSWAPTNQKRRIQITATVDIEPGQDPDGWADSVAMALQDLDGGTLVGPVRWASP